jgi:hypothetical protein
MVALVKKIDLAEPLSDGLPVLCDYETVEGAIEMLTLISEVERIAQCERIRLSPWISICGDGSTDLGKQHNFVMDIRYLDPATNDVHSEFVKLSDCPGTARAMTKAFIRMLGEIAPDLILKLVGGLKPKLVKLKRKLGVGCSVHTLAATLLSGGEDALSPALFQNMRSLLQIMLVIPASSAQSERDFSAQVRPSQCIAICGSHLQRSLPPPECAEQDQSQGAGGYVGEDAGSSHAGLHPCPHPLHRQPRHAGPFRGRGEDA